MHTYTVFLRGINVGGRIVRMSDLKLCLEKAGFGQVRTLLQSGNVVFESDRDASKTKQAVEAALTETFHYPAKVQVLTIAALQTVVENYPFGEAGRDQHDYVIFMENGLESDLVQEDYKLAPGEQVSKGGGVVYWRVDKGSTLKSDFAKQLAKAKYKQLNTNRNLRTLKKIIDL